MKKEKFSSRLAIIVCAGILAGLLTGCGASIKTAPQESYNDMVMSESSDYSLAVPTPVPDYDLTYSAVSGSNISMGFDGPMEQEVNATSSVKAQVQKLIYRLYLEIETLEYDKSIKALDAMCAEYEGYVEHSNVSGNRLNGTALRWADFTLRIPSQKLDEFERACGEIGNVFNSSRETENATAQYIDQSARLSALKLEEERLLELLGQATDLDSIIALNSRLSEIRYEIESIESSLRNIDSLVAYSIVNITVHEIVEEQVVNTIPKTFSEKVSTASAISLNQFKNSMENIGVFLLGEAPLSLLMTLIYLLPLIIIAIIALIVIRKRRRKKEAARERIIGKTNEKSEE